ncbi:methyl farnesoate epoxidase-like [Amphibalanus amphitrite]|uniref:methyl farnesoate epoxidase-like n=1 Tax=Amphibalanus amphitrite TaxID=1232801 RepID=UPI001C92921B|nr:methyl farnesoate epoxidase-like [Amphibalanus amphitrite]
MLLTLVLVVLVLVLSLWYMRPQQPVGFPPGPTTLQIGEILWAIIEARKGNLTGVIAYFQKKYGDVFGFVLPTGQKLVHILKYDDIKEACSMPEFSGRPNVFAFLVRSYQQKLGIVFNDGATWSEHRRFALRHLRDLGLGKNSMESTVLDEFEELAKEMQQDCGKPVKINFRFNLTVLNILWRMVADQRLDNNNPNAQKYIATVNDFFKTVGPKNPTNVAPWLRHVMPEWSGYAPLIRHRDMVEGMFRELVREHQSTLDRSSPRDFIDRFLIEMESPDAEAREFTERNLAVIGMDLFAGGMETTSTSLMWAVLMMVMYPDVQTRVQQELDAALGGRLPSYSDRPRLPYTEATLMEISRRATLLPQAAPHSTLSDVAFRGFTIPKDSIVLMHLGSVHMDSEYWGDPEAFRPERFLTADGAVRHDERLIPFGVGKRFCLGETLARMEMFMLFACLLQRFRFSAVPGEKLSMETGFSAVRQPQEFSAVYELRS